MSIYEYNEEYVKKSLYAEGLEDGIKEGEKVGVLKTLTKSVEAVMKNLHTDMKNTCDIIGTTVEEYEKAKWEFSNRS